MGRYRGPHEITGNRKIDYRAGSKNPPKDQEKGSRNHSTQLMAGIAGQKTSPLQQPCLPLLLV